MSYNIKLVMLAGTSSSKIAQKKSFLKTLENDRAVKFRTMKKVNNR